MKVGMVGYPTFGGSGVVATELGKALAKKGHEIHFVSYSQPVRLNKFYHNIYFHEVNIVKYPLFEYPPYELALISKLVDLINHEKLDLLHVHYAIPHAFAAYMAKTMLATEGYNLPIITTLHGTDITLVGKDPNFETAVTYSINHSDEVTTVSEYLKQATYEYFKVEKDIRVIPNFIDLENFSKDDDTEIPHDIIPEGKKVITHISNFRHVKRVEDVVKIFGKIREKEPAVLLMVGDGPDRTMAEWACRNLNYCNDVKFLGKMDTVANILNHTDLFLLPSETESFGLAALEAMACHTPVISTNAGGLPEVNINGVTGFTCDVGDIDCMSQKGLSILQSKETLDKFKQAAYDHARNYDINKIMPLYESLYHNLVETTQKEPEN